MPEVQTTPATDGHGARIALVIRRETQRDFAHRIGMHPTILSRVLSGTLRGTPAQWRSIWRGLSE